MMNAITGTWDDILIRSDELKGKRLRIEILGDANSDTRPTAPMQKMSLIEALGEFVGSVNGSFENDSENTGEKFAHDLVCKHRDEDRL